MNLGVVAYQLGDLEGAESALTAVLAQAPQDPKALHNLGMVRRKKGDVPGSLAALWEAIKSDPQDPRRKPRIAHQVRGPAESLDG